MFETRVRGVKRIQTGELYCPPCCFSFKCVLIIISASVFPSEFYRMEFHVFPKDISDKETG